MKQLLYLLLLAVTARAAEVNPFPLWPGVAPGSENWTQTEQSNTSATDGTSNVRNVTQPTLRVYSPERSKANGTAIVVCPGGGFVNLAMGKEGDQVAEWLNSIGITAFVLKYRLARTGDEVATNAAKLKERVNALIPLAVADAQQAVRLVRSRASEWGITRGRIGIMGFSAGGRLTAALALKHDPECRPDFAAPIYGGAPEDFTVPADAPPLFLVLADDDGRVRPVENSVRLYTAWNQAHIPAELHIYARGGHGFALRKSGLPVNGWPDLFRQWLDDRGFLKAAPERKTSPSPATEPAAH